jgi:hypothetical protein
MVVCQPGHDAVHREHQRRRDRGQDHVRALVVLPVAVRAAPAEGERAVDALAPLAGRAITQGREVGDETDEPEEERHREVGADREHVPEKRGLEVRPDAHLVGDGEHVEEEPWPSHVDAGEDERADDREDRHRLGEAVDRGPPLLAEEEEDGRDERPGVPDADPPHEVGDVPGPVDRSAVSPDADASPEEVSDAQHEEAGEGRGEEEGDPPALGGTVLRDPADVVGDVLELGSGRDERALSQLLDGLEVSHQ